MKIKPPYVYIGGKRRMLKLIADNIPHQFGNYFEPFLGGGAVALHVMENYPNRHYYLSDFNEEIPLVWLAIRDDPEELSELLEEHSARHSEEYFYSIRKWDRRGLLELHTDVERAARFIYICNSSHNGGYRLDNEGFCRQSFAPSRPYFTPDTENIIEINQLLNDRAIHIYKRDFNEVVEDIRAGDFIYLDPPYDVVKDETGYSSSDEYVKNVPTAVLTKQVKKLMNTVGHHGAYALASNSDTALTQKLWDGWNSVEKEIVWSSGNEGKRSTEKLWGNYALWKVVKEQHREAAEAASTASDSPDEAEGGEEVSVSAEGHTEAADAD